MQKKGFMLLELLFVVVLLMILSVHYIPTMFISSEHLLKQEIIRLTTLIQFLHQKAIMSGTDLTLCIDQKKNFYSYAITKDPYVYQLSPKIIFGFLPQVLGPPGDPVTPIMQGITFQLIKDMHYIKLFSNGKISSGTIYFIIKKNTKIMGALTCDASRVCYIRRYIYKKNTWKPFFDELYT